MTINFTFDSIEEMETAVCRMAENIEAKKIFQAGVPEEAPVAEEPKAEEPEPIPADPAPEMEEPKKEPVPADPAPKAEEPKKEEPAPKIDRTEMRKLLAQLNKQTGKNTARELISGMGYRALTDVPDDRLAELKAKAEEVLNA